MTVQEVLAEIRPLGRDSYKKVLLNHGVKEPFFGVKIEELKKIQKRVRKDYRLALELYQTGNYDAMYLAGLIADDMQMTKEDLRRWAEKADQGALAGTTVASVAAGGRHGWELALEWIESGTDHIATAGWATLSLLVTTKDDSELNHAALKGMLQRVERTIHQAPNNARYQMNGFVIAVGACVPALTELALQTGETIGRVTVDMGKTACQVPFAPDCIRRIEKRSTIGKKRKSAKC